MTEEQVPQEQTGQPPSDDDETSPEAPYGWMEDPLTGQMRPRKRPGRRRNGAKVPAGKSPAIEELQALGSLGEASEDRAPAAPPPETKRGGVRPMMKAESAPLPPFRAGVIAKGVNSLYRRAGRIVRIWDDDIGRAIILTTTAADDDDVTVGEAWESVAKTNPRIRAFLLKMIQGGAWTTVFTAHLPILMALVMKDSIRRRIPILQLADSFLLDEPDESGYQPPSDFSQMMGGINPDDMAQMMQMVQTFAGTIAQDVGRQNTNAPRDPNGQD